MRESEGEQGYYKILQKLNGTKCFRGDANYIRAVFVITGFKSP